MLITDHLGTPRLLADLSGSLAGMTRHDYLPFGEEAGAGIGGRTTAQGYSSNDNIRQQWHTLERDDETGLDYAQARYYASAQGRFTGADPLMASGRTGAPQTWNRYTYGYNNPLRFTDPNGMVAGDYYNQDAKLLGTDGIDDGKLYVVTDKDQAKQIEQTNKSGGTTQVGDVSSAVELPSAGVRGEIGAAVERSNSPTQDDKKGGFHEEGGIWGIDANGKERVVNAAPGAYSDPRIQGGTASIDISKPANPAEAGILTSLGGTFHIHPNGKIPGTLLPPMSGNGTTVIGGPPTATQTATFNQPPSAVDIRNAKTLGVANSIVVGARDKTVYIYNGSGLRATFPLKQFLSIGRR
jgi:RHS repeat-associated protein